MSKLIARLYDRAGLIGFHDQDLRRTFVALVRENINDELMAMRLLRDQVPILNNRYLLITNTQLRDALNLYSPLRIIKTVSPSRVTGDCLVETGESRTPRPEEAAQDILQV